MVMTAWVNWSRVSSRTSEFVQNRLVPTEASALRISVLNKMTTTRNREVRNSPSNAFKV